MPLRTVCTFSWAYLQSTSAQTHDQDDKHHQHCYQCNDHNLALITSQIKQIQPLTSSTSEPSLTAVKGRQQKLRGHCG